MTPSAYLIKSPPQQINDDIARERVEACIWGEDDVTLTGADSDAVEEAEAIADLIGDFYCIIYRSLENVMSQLLSHRCLC